MVYHRNSPACVGILGGMGPRATVDLFQKLVEATPARQDRDHIPVLVYSVPQIPDRTAAILKGGPSPLEDMCRGVRTLEGAGASLIAIACNTAHYWYDEMQRKAYVPLLHIVDAVLEELRSDIPPDAAIGILGTSGTIRSAIYDRMLKKKGYGCIVPFPDTQSLIDNSIALVKAGRTGEARADFLRGAEHLIERGARAVVLACSEIPLAVRDGDLNVPAIDATAALARQCVRRVSILGEA